MTSQFSDAFSRSITTSACEQLEQQGYVIIDRMFGSQQSQLFLEEMNFLMDNGFVKPNKTQFATPEGAVALFTKPNIYELDLHDVNIRKMLTEFNELFDRGGDDLVSALNHHLPCLQLVSGPNGKTIKLQINKGNGGCFPHHYDNPGRPNKRQLTCLLYLNKDWKNGDGGELQLTPFLGKKVIIEPLFDRFVIFYSDRVLHRVLPAVVMRHCFTIWIDGSQTNTDDDVLLKAKHIDASEQGFMQSVEALRRSPLQRVLSRSIYAEEYEQSLRECMKDSDGGDVMISAHRLHLRAASANPRLQAFVDRCRQYRQENDC